MPVVDDENALDVENDLSGPEYIYCMTEHISSRTGPPEHAISPNPETLRR